MTTDHDIVIRDADADGRRVDVVVRGGRIAAIGAAGSLDAAERVDAGGGALLPGLHDHHVHLLAAAAVASSVRVGPADVTGPSGLRTALRRHPASSDGWIRGVDYHESVCGRLDRHRLDEMVSDRPVRIQHRSGLTWTLNSAALRMLGDALDHAPPGVERDATGEPTGELRRLDTWLGVHLPDRPLPDLDAISHTLTEWGVTGVTDTTPVDDPSTLALLADAVSDGTIAQHLVVSTGVELAGVQVPEPLGTGPVKIVLDEADVPSLDTMIEWIRTAHTFGRPAAVHSVDRSTFVFTVVAFRTAGSAPGDRIEHGAVIPPEMIDELRRLGLTIVTQPSFIRERGDQYLADVEPWDLADLYRCGSLLGAGVAVAGSSDLPYTSGDPWAAMRTAHTRSTVGGATVGPDEAITARRALDLYLGPLDAPGGPPRRVALGAPADLIVLDRPLHDVLRHDRTPTVTTVLRQGGRTPGSGAPRPC